MADVRPKIVVDVDVNAPLFWKSVDKALPESFSRLVLAWGKPIDAGFICDEGYVFACYNGIHEKWVDEEDGELQVTHWAELPGAPN